MLRMNIQLFAHKKGVGSTKNGRDSESKRLGVKRADGQICPCGQIFWCGRGEQKSIPGNNVGSGSDDTLFALWLTALFVSSIRGKLKKQVSVYPREIV